MLEQKSFIMDVTGNQTGSLYLVPTPIGNLADITYRAVDILNESDLILAEDTRQTAKLLAHYKINRPMQSFHEHTRVEQMTEIVQQLKSGQQLALVSDAGMPLINDPGHPLVQACLQANIPVVALPGANAALTALIASGLPANTFTYYGFFPRKRKEQEMILQAVGQREETAIFYESPHRIVTTLKAISNTLSVACQVTVARELTKRFETYLRGTVGDLLDFVESQPLKGEIVLMISGGGLIGHQRGKAYQDLSLKEHVEWLMAEENMKLKEAIKQVARIRGVKRGQAYDAYHGISR